MSILSRFSEIMSANVNALLDRMEDPGRMVDELLRRMRKELAQVKSETAGVMAQETAALREVDRVKGEIAKDLERAKKALLAKNEVDASIFITRKQESEALLAQAEKTLALAADNASRMRQMYNKLTEDIRALDAKKATIKGKAAVARTQEALNRMGSSSDRFAGTAGRVDELEARVDARLDRAMAEASLNEAPPDEASALEQKYDIACPASVEDELAALKAELEEA